MNERPCSICDAAGRPGASRMRTENDIEYHCDRAIAESALASAASSRAAAEAHRALSELHIERMRALSETNVAHLPLQTVS